MAGAWCVDPLRPPSFWHGLKAYRMTSLCGNLHRAGPPGPRRSPPTAGNVALG